MFRTLASPLFAFLMRRFAQDGPSYQRPPQALVDLVDAPPPSTISLDPTRRHLLMLEPRGLVDLEELSRPELKLAGLAIDPLTSGESRLPGFRRLTLRDLPDGPPRPIKGLPRNPRVSHVSWSPDGTHLAFTLTRARWIELWVVTAASGEARRLGDFRLNAVTGRPYAWLSDAKTLVVRSVPVDRGPAPRPPISPPGPLIQESRGVKAPARTYPDLLKNPYDEALFDHFLSSQLLLVGLDGKARQIGKVDRYTDVAPSPDARYLLVERVHRPYSYVVPIQRFPTATEVWDLKGRLVHLAADTPLAEAVPVDFDAVPPGPRHLDWRSDAPATLAWIEALDGGDPKQEAEFRDAVLMLPAPFTGEPETLIRLGYRFGQINWANDGLAFVFEDWWKTRRERTWIVRPGKPGSRPHLLFDRSSEDHYGDPGAPFERRNPQGQFVVALAPDGKSAFLRGDGASPEGLRPFVDRLDLATLETTRLWRNEGECLEVPLALLDDRGQVLLTSRESPSESPNFYIRRLDTGTLTALTHFPDPFPQLAGVKKELIHYRRDDGVQLSGTLFLPKGYDPERDGPLPTILWAYPQEFKSADAAGQITDSPYRYSRVRTGSPLYWLARGYAILDDPKLPIIGQGDTEPNDTYIPQLVAGAKAAIDELVRRGVTDPQRVAIGGHSYGAFMTANLLAHSGLFAAGIARSGAYNRTLTPFGFQSEERTMWDAPEVYQQMSPFNYADRIKAPLLIIHGAADMNSGTFPMQSERLYQAIKGLGGHARLVMLPYEGHGYMARESVLHMLYEMDSWLEAHVKQRSAAAPAKAESKKMVASSRRG